MSFLLRKIRKARWSVDRPTWLEPGEIQGDPVGDLATQGNSLSVWSVDENLTTIERVAAALAASGDSISNVDYALFDEAALADLRIRVERTEGSTPDAYVNENWHRDLVELSGNKLLLLAHLILESGRRERLPEKRVRELLTSEVSSGAVDPGKLKQRIREQLLPVAR